MGRQVGGAEREERFHFSTCNTAQGDVTCLLQCQLQSQLPIIINRQSLPYIKKTTLNQYIEHSMSTEEKEPVAAKEEEEEEEDLEKLQAEIARMEAEAARIAQETEDLDKSAGEAAASTSVAAEGKKSDADTTNKDG